MKYLPVGLALIFALSLCNLSEKFKHGNSNSGGGSGSSSSSGNSGGSAEKGEPTAAQAAAIAGGQEAKWDRQGMSWTVPAKWKESTNESKEYGWASPGNEAFLIVSISPMGEDFPTDVSINAFYEGAKTRAKNGEVDEVKWVEIDGLKGVQFREANPEKSDGIRRLQWLAYRKFTGQVQMVNVMLSSNGKQFPAHQDEMYGTLYSMKITH